jgi:class 3 adenylate cyclase/tetratricopeptide (TPR) repeat protein
VRCASCGSENVAGSKFCNHCGTRLAVACPSCGTPNPADAAFCNECGTRLAAGPSPAVTAAATSPEHPATTPVAERRLVTILFADLVGFTTIAEGRDAEDTRELLSRYFDLSRDVIGRYGGTVEKFIGDAVMAVWGAPTAREDDAERAVRAGLDLVDAVRSLGPGIAARAGVLTGEAAVTIGATNQGMVAGDLVNTASRLQTVAASGTVLVGEATQRAASKSIAFEPAGEQTLKGKVAPVPAWRALRVVSERGGRNRSDTLEAPFVGRDDELRQLKDLFHGMGRDGRARLVSVIGPAGIGKSRLAWEFLKYLDGLVDRIWWHDGRSPAYGEGISFWALGEMIRERAGLLETDDEPTTRAKVAAMLGTHVPDETERRWIEPALLALLGVESAARPDQLFGAWRTFFERLAASGPVVMVFEDHHFADSGLLDFVDHLLEWARSAPIYVVTLARPELLEKRPDWGAGKRNFTSIYLEPLPEPAMRDLLSGLVPGLPDAAVRAIVDRADGIPLYAVETVRMLLAEGRLALDDGTYRPVGDLTSLAVPETLTALIASRLDGLAGEDRALVSDAAVLGQSFTLAGLSAVAGIPEAELEPRLRALVRRELLTLETDPRSPERGQYAFVQALIREVAYNTLARRDRKARHLAAARYFESLETDEIAGGLAGHYLAAHENASAGPEAEALAGQARIALRAAAERAIALGSLDQAVTLLRQALTVATDPAETAELLERAGEMASSAGRHDDAEAFLVRATELDRERGDRTATARAIAALGKALLSGRRTAEAAALLDAAVAEFADLGDDPALVALHSQLARACFFAGDNRRSVEMADRALEVAEHTDLVPLLADTLITKGTALGAIGRLREGVGAIETGERLARSAGLMTILLRGLNNRAVSQGEFDPAATREALAEGLAIARRMGLRFWAFGFAVGIGYTDFRLGDWDRSVAVLAEALADGPAPEDRIQLLANAVLVPAWRGEDVAGIVAELEHLLGANADPTLAGNLHDARGAAAVAAGRLREGQIECRLAAAANTSVNGTESRLLAAHVAFWGGDLPGAAAELAALDASGYRTPVVEARRVTMRAGLAAGEGRRTEALGLYRDALRRWRDVGLVVDEALTVIDMATLLGPTEPEVSAAAEGAREILARLGATPFLARLDAAMEGRPAVGATPTAAPTPTPTPTPTESYGT